MEQNNHKVSIIIVTLNAGNTLQLALDSIYKQQYPNIEIIIQDGESTDNTLSILENNNVKIACWMSEKDNGVYDAMNKALSNATGDWIYFLGADDTLLPAFSDMVYELSDSGVIYYGNVFAEGGIKLGELTKKQFAKYGPYHQAMIYPRVVFDKYKYNTKYKISADFALTIALIKDPSFRFCYKDYVIANFNHEGISGANIDAAFQNDKPGLIYKNFGLKIWLSYMFHRLKNRDNPRA